MGAIGCSAIVDGVGRVGTLQILTFFRRGTKRPVRQSAVLIGKYYILEDDSSKEFEKRIHFFYEEARKKGIKEPCALLYWAYSKARLVSSLHAGVEEDVKGEIYKKFINPSPCLFGEGGGLIKKLPAKFY